MADKPKSDGFVARWSRLKHDASERPAPKQTDPTSQPAVAAPKPAPALSPIDLSKLPAIDSITADTDISGFLAPGVPAALTRAALRRAWVVDPKIRTFIGIAENQWDFTAPNTIPGFGDIPLEAVRRLVADVIGDKPADAEKVSAPSEPGEAMSDVGAQPTSETPPPRQIVAAQQDPIRPNEIPDPEVPPRWPRHGGALPRE